MTRGAPEEPAADRPGPEGADALSASGLDPTRVRPSVHDVLGVTVVEATPERVVMTLPVTWKTHQPTGILHGGVSALLAESAASYGAALNAPGRRVAGIELNASHLRPMTDGTLTATATPVRAGRTVSVWSIVLTGDDGREVCRARCSVAVLGPLDPADFQPTPR